MQKFERDPQSYVSCSVSTSCVWDLPHGRLPNAELGCIFGVREKEKGGKKLEKLQDNHGGWRFWTQTYQYGFVVLVGYGLPCDAFLFIFFLFHQKNVLKGNDMENVIIRFMEWQIKSCWKQRQSPWSNVAFKWFVTSAALSFPHYRQINLVKVVKLNDHIFLYVYFLSLYWQRQSKLRLQSIKLELTPHKRMTKNMKHFNMCTYQTIFLYKY